MSWQCTSTKFFNRFSQYGTRILAAVLLVSVVAFVQAQTLEYALMPGPVIEGHADLETDCRKCHEFFSPSTQPKLCVDCHEDIGEDFAEKHGYHGSLEGESPCRSCHTEHKGRKARIVLLDERVFNHRLTDFPLAGKHRQVACRNCHQSTKKHREAPHSCGECHLEQDVHKNALGARCDECHEEHSWKGAEFDHSSTGFELWSEHVKISCTGCHARHVYSDTPTKCVGCHLKEDKHKDRYGEDCGLCHRESAWKELTFRHDRDTNYILRWQHRPVACEQCHLQPVYSVGTPGQCIGCHRNDDVHKTALGKQCDDCHDEQGWKDAEFDHSGTGFELLSEHAKVPCTGCHARHVYSDTPKKCAGCHLKEDKHKGRYGEDCVRCHQESAWKELTFNHNRDTNYILRWLHRPVACAQCHLQPVYSAGTPSQCIGCHKKDDVHKTALGKQCDKCHSERSWEKSFFDHNRDSRFVLRRAHKKVQCKGCHKDEKFVTAPPTTCQKCHSGDDRSKGHRGRFGQRCQDCHTESNWKTVRFNHKRVTRYALLGKHRKLSCTKCHSGRLYEDKVKASCNFCHKGDDVHKGELGTACELCHIENDWKESIFDHSDSRFRLQGKHRDTACTECHNNGRFRNVGTGCIDCHRKDDKHKERLGARCDSCHNSDSWKAWDFDHDRLTRFALNGMHRKSRCLACHIEKVRDEFTVPMECYACHKQDDVHFGSLSRRCGECHGAQNWRNVSDEARGWAEEGGPPAKGNSN